jgi:hypothetical protein
MVFRQLTSEGEGAPRHSRRRWLAVAAAIGLLSVIVAVPVLAQSVAMSGSFYRHHFQLVPGESMHAPDVYVVVFNHGEEDLTVSLVSQAPPSVAVVLAERDFVLGPGEEKQVTVGVEAGLDAIPGDYVITITAHVETEGEGIAVVGAAQQQARLSILGEAGLVSIEIVDCFGDPLPVEVHLCRVQGDEAVPCGFASNGLLDAKLVPGEYVVQAFYNDIELAKEKFTLVAGDDKTVTVVANTIFIRGFTVVPNFHNESGDIAFARIVYTIDNAYQPRDDVRARLAVSRDGVLVEEDEIFSLPTLSPGNMEGSYNYTPADGWRNGLYSFTLSLTADGSACAEEQVRVMEVVAGTGGTSVATIAVSVVGGLLVLAVAVWWLVLRRRRFDDSD